MNQTEIAALFQMQPENAIAYLNKSVSPKAGTGRICWTMPTFLRSPLPKAQKWT